MRWRDALRAFLDDFDRWRSRGEDTRRRKERGGLDPTSSSSSSSSRCCNGDESPFEAARRRDLVALRHHFDSGCPVDRIDDATGDTVLLVACRLGFADVARLALVEYHARNDPHPDYGQTALQVAVSAGHTSIVKLILETAAPSGADSVIVNHEDENGEAPIHVTTRCGNIEILELLISHGANLGLIEKNGRTCLHLAAQSGHGPSLALALDSGADEYLEVLSDDGFAALHLAVRANRADCVRILLEAGADVSAETASGTNVYNLSSKQRSERITRLLLEYDVSDEESSCEEGGVDGNPTNGENLMRGVKKFTLSPTKPTHRSSFPGSLVSPVKQMPIHQNYYGGRSSSAGGAAPLREVFPGGVQSSRSLSQITHSPILRTNRRSSLCGGSTSGCISDGYSSAGGEFKHEGDTWMKYITEDGHPYFYNVNRNSSTWEDPRLQLPAPRVHALLPRNLQAERPASASFRKKLTAIPQLNRNLMPTAAGIATPQESITKGKDAVQSMHIKPGPTGALQPLVKPERAGTEKFLMSEINSHSMGTGGEGITGKIPRPQTSSNVLSLSKLAPKTTAHSQAQTPGPAGTAPPTPMMLDEAYTKMAHAMMEQVEDTSGSVVGEILMPSSKVITVKKEEDIDPKIILLPKITSIPMCPSSIFQSAQPLVSPKSAATSEIIAGETLTPATSSPPSLSLRTVIEEHEEITSIPMGPSSIIQAAKLPAPTLVPSPVTPGLDTRNELFGQIKFHYKGIDCDIAGEKLSISPPSMKPAMFKKEDTDPKGAHETAVAAKSCAVSTRAVSYEETRDRTRGGSGSDSSDGLKNVDAIAKYVRMKAVGIPVEAIIHKMIQDGVEAANIDLFRQFDGGKQSAVPNAKLHKTEISSRLNTDEAIKKFMQMVSFGVPAEAVANKMKSEGIEKAKIAIFNEFYGLGISSPDLHSLPLTRKASVPTSKFDKHVNIISKEDLAKDGTLSKYVKMSNVGVPLSAVLAKMSQDGIVNEKIIIYNAAFGLKTTNAISPKWNPTTMQRGQRRASKAMQKIHWTPILAEERLQNSLWASDNGVEIKDFDIEKLESLFSASPKNKSVGGQVRAVAKTQEPTSLIDPKRANNIAIALAQFRAFSTYDDLCQAVASFNHDNLNIENLTNMQLLLPTPEELSNLKLYNGQNEILGRAELFFLSVMKVPQLQQKLASFKYYLQFDELVRSLSSSLQLLAKACSEVIESEKLASMLRRLLAIGNLMNESAGKVQAKGITLDSLIQTATKRGSDDKTTVLDLLVSTAISSRENIVDFWLDMPSLRDAMRLDLEDCRLLLRDIQNGADSVDRSIKAETSQEADSPRGSSADAYLTKLMPFALHATCELHTIKITFSAAEDKVRSLCSFFAEDSKTCKASTIFGVLLELSRLVEKSKECMATKVKVTKTGKGQN